MSLTFQESNNLHPIAKIISGKYNGKAISLNDKLSEIDNTDFQKLKLPNDTELQILPDTKLDRQIIYCTGCSGSGKSTFIRKYCKEYKKKFKDNEIYLFSALKSDDSLDEIKPKRFKIDESLVSDPLDVEDLKDSLVIFDDIDVIANKKVRDAVYNILNQVLEISRHFRTYCCVSNHLPTNGIWTRRILNESSVVVWFPQSAGGKVKYMLQTYLDLDEKMIKYFKRSSSRWCAIYKNFPQLYVLQHEIALLNQDSYEDN